MKSTDLVALVGRIWQPMAEVKDSHEGLVGAEGFEPPTSLEFNQGALTAELHAYIYTHHYTEGIQRMTCGPMIFVRPNGIRFHKATGSWNLASTGLRCGTSFAFTKW